MNEVLQPGGVFVLHPQVPSVEPGPVVGAVPAIMRQRVEVAGPAAPRGQPASLASERRTGRVRSAVRWKRARRAGRPRRRRRSAGRRPRRRIDDRCPCRQPNGSFCQPCAASPPRRPRFACRCRQSSSHEPVAVEIAQANAAVATMEAGDRRGLPSISRPPEPAPCPLPVLAVPVPAAGEASASRHLSRLTRQRQNHCAGARRSGPPHRRYGPADHGPQSTWETVQWSMSCCRRPDARLLRRRSLPITTSR